MGLGELRSCLGEAALDPRVSFQCWRMLRNLEGSWLRKKSMNSRIGNRIRSRTDTLTWAAYVLDLAELGEREMREG